MRSPLIGWLVDVEWPAPDGDLRMLQIAIPSESEYMEASKALDQVKARAPWRVTAIKPLRAGNCSLPQAAALQMRDAQATSLGAAGR